MNPLLVVVALVVGVPDPRLLLIADEMVIGQNATLRSIIGRILRGRCHATNESHRSLRERHRDVDV